MQLKILAMMMGAVVLSLSFITAPLKYDPSSKENLKRLKQVHYFEEVFDNVHLGSLPYESFN